MTRDELRSKLLELMKRIAPEIDPGTVQPDEPLQQAFEIDSYDLLNFLVAVRDELGVTVDEADYDRLETLDTTLDFLMTKLQSS